MKRRDFLALLFAAIVLPSGILSQSLAPAIALEDWATTHDRVFLGGGVWANPMEDWRVEDGWAVCQTAGGGRNIHSLLHELVDPTRPFSAVG